MKAAAAALAAVAAALALQTTLASLVIRGTAALDLVLIVVVYVALVSGPVRGLLLGLVAGLIQDALSSGIIGVGGLAKTGQELDQLGTNHAQKRIADGLAQHRRIRLVVLPKPEPRVQPHENRRVEGCRHHEDQAGARRPGHRRHPGTRCRPPG